MSPGDNARAHADRICNRAAPEAPAQPSPDILLTALRFYARGEHYLLDEAEEFDTVSGEPQNWLASGREDSISIIEDGQVARSALRGQAVNWVDGDDDQTPQPIEGEVFAEGAQPVRAPLLLKGIGKIAGDGWKDLTRIGEVVYAWNREKPEPYKEGRFPRLGNPIYCASTEQFDFQPLTDDEAIAAVDGAIEALRVKLMDFKHPVTAGHFRRNESDQWFEVPRDTQDTTKLYHAPGWPHAGLPIKADPLTQAIQRLNANPYSLTKSECIDVLDKLRAELGR